MFACKRHWYKLRKQTRDAIWREYNPLRYLAVQRFACGELVFEPNDEEAAAKAVPYFTQAILLRDRCIKDGHGDPLKGLLPENV